MKTTQIQTLHHRLNKKTKMPGTQYIPHAAGKQCRLLWRVSKITGHYFLSLNQTVENKYSHKR